ncbi:hypothetical protein HYQ46_008244 [Verticillium longisporum]|nr:hypothetical protein HYQ46_008244 [Verticillium longisporum]
MRFSRKLISSSTSCLMTKYGRIGSSLGGGRLSNMSSSAGSASVWDDGADMATSNRCAVAVTGSRSVAGGNVRSERRVCN